MVSDDFFRFENCKAVEKDQGLPTLIEAGYFSVCRELGALLPFFFFIVLCGGNTGTVDEPAECSGVCGARWQFKTLRWRGGGVGDGAVSAPP